MEFEPHQLLIGVVAHDSRAEQAHDLADSVQAQVLNIDDTRARGQDEAITACVTNHLTVLRQLRSLSTDRRWCIVLEDDALPVADFRFHAAAALRHVRSPLVGFYISRAGAALNLEALQRARSAGTAWAVANHLVSAVAYAIRTDILPDIVDCLAYSRPEATVERCLTDWAIVRRSSAFAEPRFYYTLPSLVDHSPGKSIIFKNAHSRIRRAWKLGVPDSWDTPAVEYDPNI